MPRHLFCMPLILAAALAIAADSAQNWVEVHSPRFTVITNSSEKQGRRIATQFERMRALFEKAYPDLESDPDSPVVVLAIKNKYEFRALEPATYLAKGALNVHGLFVRSGEKNYILMRLDSGNPYPVVYHEYTHLLLSTADSRIPLWLNEGLAEFYENTEIYDRNVLLGEANEKLLTLLRQERFLPLEILFTVNEKSPYYLEQKKGSLFYAEAWALTHYLSLKDYAEKTSKIDEYTKLVGEQVDPVTAGRRVFGDLKKLKRSLELYVEHSSFSHFEVKIPAKMEDSNFTVESISSTQADAMKADFLVSSGRAQEARGLLQDLLTKDSDNPMVQEIKAMLQSAEEAEAENKLRAALQQSPPSAAAYDALASFLWKIGKGLDEAPGIESTAVSLDPGNVEYRIKLANLLLSVGRAPSAVETLNAAAQVARSPQESETIAALLSEATKIAAAQDSQQRQIADNHSALPPRSEAVTSAHQEFVPRGPHRFFQGVLKAVHCDPPHLDLIVASRAKTMTLYAENFYKIQFTALFTPTADLNPCEELENRPAKVEYVESVDGSETPRLIAVELHQ